MSNIHTRCVALFAAALILMTGATGCVREMHQTLEIRADGSAVLITDATADRQVIEQQVAARSAYGEEGMMGGDEDEGWVDRWAEGVQPPAGDETAGEPEEAPAEPGDMTDEELVQAIRAAMNDNPLYNVEGVAFEMPTVEVGEGEVRIVTHATFDSLRELATYLPYVTGNSPIEAVRLEADDEGRLKVTLGAGTPDQVDQTFGMVRSMLGGSQFKGSFTVRMPGEIAETTLPRKEGAEATIAVDASDPASFDAAQELLKETLTVVADAGGLDLSVLPLDSDELDAEIDWGGEPAVAAGEVVEAEPGYVVEPLSATVVRVHRFPGADAHEPEFFDPYFGQEGTAVQARLHAPESRRLLSAGRVTVTRAVDDMGRDVPLVESDRNASGYGGGMFSMGMDDEMDHRSLEFQVALGVPPLDAAAIEEVEGTVVATTFSDWRMHRIEDPHADPGSPIDLSELLPGARMVIERVRERQEGEEGGSSREGYIRLSVTGPEAIRDLQITVEVPGSDHAYSHPMNERFQDAGDHSERDLLLNWEAHRWRDQGQAVQPPVLVIRYPDGLRHERVPFLLEALDLF